MHTIIFVRFLILRGTLYQNLRICINQSTRWATGSTGSTNFFEAVDRLATGSSGLLANNPVFGIFSALFLVGLSLGAPNGFGG